MHFSDVKGQRNIILEKGQAEARSRFSGFHEIAHELFQTYQAGKLAEQLRIICRGDHVQSVKSEENLCYKAAGLLLMPTKEVKSVVEQFGHTPLAVLHLADATRDSLEAAMRRLVEGHAIALHAFILNLEGYVLDVVAHGGRRGNSNPGKDFQIVATHPILRAAFRHYEQERFEATVPFKRSHTQWKSKVYAVADLNRKQVVAYFLDDWQQQSVGKMPLFPDL